MYTASVGQSFGPIPEHPKAPPAGPNQGIGLFAGSVGARFGLARNVDLGLEAGLTQVGINTRLAFWGDRRSISLVLTADARYGTLWNLHCLFVHVFGPFTDDGALTRPEKDPNAANSCPDTGAMADSNDTMPRLDQLEASVANLSQAMVQVSEILLDQNQRIDSVRASVVDLGDRLGGRLDRLIELQTRSFTEWGERHQSHEQRIAALEARVERLEK